MRDGGPAAAADDTEASLAFGHFVAAQRGALLRTAAAMLGRPGSDPEDLVQSALVRLAPVWEEVENPLAYTRQILARLAIDAGRRRRRRPEVLGLDHGDVARAAEAAATGPDISDRAAVSDELWRALAALNPRQRRVLALRFFADCSEAETARILHCPVGTVKSECHRGLKRLRTALDLPLAASSAERPMP